LSARLKIAVRGAVQGVGFRPFIYRLATELGLSGWVNNSAQGVFIEVEGPKTALDKFLLRLDAEKPPRSFIQSLEPSWLDTVGYMGFEIRESEAGGARTALVLPDVAACPDCLREVFDPANRRYFYPFTNCTNCGPRFSIIESLPYDRANTSMKRFSMCPQCQAEYDDPRDRRFHAQPNACPECGPQLQLWDRAGSHSLDCETLATAAQAIREGKIVAVKGLGGFHLMVAAQDEQAVRRLRELKHREEKPFALMFPSLEAVRAVSHVSPLEERLLRSPEAPIVLLKQVAHAPSPIAPSVAPGNPNLGVMLPYTPLHHLLMSLVGVPVVATSGNLNDEPICTDEHEALERLGGIADLFLVHNRPIVRHVDDSIVRVMMGRELVLRRARGYAPLPVPLPLAMGNCRLGSENVILAVGAHLKNTIALSVGPQVFLSQHIGDLETDQAYEAFRRVIADFEHLYEARPSVVAADAHPDYLSTKFARALVGQASSPAGSAGVPARSSNLANPQPSTLNPQLLSIQHHVAHVLSCMAENELRPPVLGVSWDGTGYGLDGTVWGGEFFIVTETSCERVAHLRQFRLPGGDRAVKEPRRTALGLLYELFGEAAFAMSELAPVGAFSPGELDSLKTMLTRKLNSPLTSSAGRLFDAVAALVGLRQQVRFEGQAAMELEFAIESLDVQEFYPFRAIASEPLKSPLAPTLPMNLDWSPVIKGILCDLAGKVPIGEISARFHNGLAEAIIAVARHAGLERVALSGGCFQNRYLTERTVQRLRAEGFLPYWHQRVPPNDGGIALGQVVAALRQERLRHSG
jgi:hydrogenase maturation protein HypF